MTVRGVFFIVVSLVWFSFSLSGCRSVKRHTATGQKTIKATEIGTRRIITKGDSVIYKPRIKYKDTVITRVHKNVILRTEYKNGKINKIDCKQKAQEVLEDYIKQQQSKETTQTTDVERESPVKDVWFLYLGLIVVSWKIIDKLFENKKE